MVPSAGGISTIPASIGRHEIVCGLGEGGMARVYLALQRGAFDATKLVVVKHIRPEYASDDEFLAMFVDEARIAVRLSHPNVVHTYEVIAEAPVYCLVMEFLEGQTLTQLLKQVGREHFALDDHIWILTQVLAGLTYAHELSDFDGTPLGIVHRDVTPSNVFITSAGEVKLLDFGIAKAAGAVSLTQQGVIKGKIGYAAPEQCLSQNVDQRADVYSVGVMLWEAIAGRRRTFGTTPLAAFRTRIEAGEPPIESAVADVAPELAEICRLALALDPAARYGSSRQLRSSLESYLARRGHTSRGDAVGALLRASCSEELARLKRALELHAATRPAPSLGSYYRSPGSTSSMRPITGDRSDEPASGLERIDGARRRKTQLLVGAAAVAVAGLGAAGASGLFAGTPVAQPSAVTAPAPASAAPSAPAAAPHMRLIVAVSPGSAKVTLDGQPIDNPYIAERPADGTRLELHASADGYVPVQRSLVLTHDLELKLALNREVSVRRAGAASQPSAPPPERSSAPAPAVVAKTAVPSTKANSSLEPGADLRAGAAARSGRKIDNKDPYSP